jgi:prolyl-tRNA synthetase
MAESPITPRTRDFAAWYQDVVLQGDMAEPAEIVKGCMVIKANGYAVWELLQRELDTRFKATNHQNMYFPLLIPKSFLEKEAEHVEGFSPELAVVTIAGGKELEELTSSARLRKQSSAISSPSGSKAGATFRCW